MSKVPVCKDGLVHRGFFHERTHYDQSYRNNRRETVFAQAWEDENSEAGRTARISSHGLLNSLMTKETIQRTGNSGYPRLERVGSYDENAAAVAATVVQWLGTNVGFDFLVQTLDKAGYDVVERRNKR